MRYLIENNDYEILYYESLSFRLPYINGKIGAYLKDKITRKKIYDSESYKNNNIEKCLMKLGKRMIKRWQNLKK